MVRKSDQPVGSGGDELVSQPNGNDEGNSTPQEEVFDPSAIFAELAADQRVADEYSRDAAGNIRYNKDGSPRKKRGRKGSGTTSAKSGSRNPSLVSGIETLANSLLVVHAGIASFTKFDDFALTDTEANTLSTSVVNVMQEFDMTPDPRIVAVFGLVTTASMIYGPRFYLYSEHRAAKAKQKKEEKIINDHFATPAFDRENDVLMHGGLRGN